MIKIYSKVIYNYSKHETEAITFISVLLSIAAEEDTSIEIRLNTQYFALSRFLAPFKIITCFSARSLPIIFLGIDDEIEYKRRQNGCALRSQSFFKRVHKRSHVFNELPNSMHATSIFRSNIGLFKLFVKLIETFFTLTHSRSANICTALTDSYLARIIPAVREFANERQSVLGRKESIWKRRQGRAISSHLILSAQNIYRYDPS